MITAPIAREMILDIDKSTVVDSGVIDFGSEMEKIMTLLKTNRNIRLYLPESFEWVILKSGVVKSAEVDDILKDPAANIESGNYISWERFFLSLLVQKTDGTYLKYSKTLLNQAYLQPAITAAILKVPRAVFCSRLCRCYLIGYSK